MLTMRAGFEWRQFGVSESENDGMQMFWTDDVIRYVLHKHLEAEPGTKFNYTNGVPTVTGAIIMNAVGMDVSSQRNISSSRWGFLDTCGRANRMAP